MPSNKFTLSLLVVINSMDPAKVEEVQKELAALVPMSFSPYREQPSLNDCLEFHATAVIDEKQKELLIEKLNNDWDYDEDNWWAYGFNTKMFNKVVYYLNMEILPKRSE